MLQPTSNNEIANLYSERVASRVRTGLEGNVFRAVNIEDKRYKINQLTAKRITMTEKEVKLKLFEDYERIHGLVFSKEQQTENDG